VNGALKIELCALKRWKIGETIGESLEKDWRKIAVKRRRTKVARERLEKDCCEKKEVEGCCKVLFLFLFIFL
jgi:hypothetical protein